MSDVIVGDVVQITEADQNGYIGAFLLVEEVKPWGVQGFIHRVESFTESTRIHLRLKHDQFERIGSAVMVPEDIAEAVWDGSA